MESIIEIEVSDDLTHLLWKSNDDGFLICIVCFAERNFLMELSDFRFVHDFQFVYNLIVGGTKHHIFPK